MALSKKLQSTYDEIMADVRSASAREFISQDDAVKLCEALALGIARFTGDLRVQSDDQPEIEL